MRRSVTRTFGHESGSESVIDSMTSQSARISCRPWTTTIRSRKKASLLAGQLWTWNAAQIATADAPIAPAPRATPATQPSASGRRMATTVRPPKTSAQRRLDAPSVTIDRRDRT